MVALWKLYLRLTHILRLFVFAERTGKFILHLHCMELFIPVFHAAGHFAYAKCTSRYLQQMKSLTEKIPENDYHLFSGCGYFTIRRKDNYFSGIFGNIVIEQDLMRLFKSSGGMTRGLGINDSTISTFVNAMPHCSFLEDFTGVMKSSSEQHIYLCPSTMAHGTKDKMSFFKWFKAHSPLLYSLVCLSTGVVANVDI